MERSRTRPSARVPAMRITLWIPLLVACARGGAPADVDALAPDASAEVTPKCDLSKPFGAPVPVEGLNSTSDDSELWFSPDQLTAYFVSQRPGGLGSYDLYFATRPDRASPFSTPVLIPNVNGASHDGTPLVSADGLTLYFAAIREGAARDIYIATRSSTAAAFGTPSKLLNVNDATGHETATYINASGTTLYMSSNKTGDWEMHRATRASAGDPFSAPVPLGELNG